MFGLMRVTTHKKILNDANKNATELRIFAFKINHEAIERRDTEIKNLRESLIMERTLSDGLRGQLMQKKHK